MAACSLAGLREVAPEWACGRCKQHFTHRTRVVMFDVRGPKSGIASSSLWFSFLYRWKKKKKGKKAKKKNNKKKKVSVGLSGRPEMFCPGKVPQTYSSVSRCALEKTAPSSACSLLWLRSLRKRREKRGFTWHRKQKLMDQIGRRAIRQRKTTEGSLKHASRFIQRPETDTMMSYGAEGEAKSLGRKSIQRWGWDFCARQRLVQKSLLASGLMYADSESNLL